MVWDHRMGTIDQQLSFHGAVDLCPWVNTAYRHALKIILTCLECLI